jgi:hypothetical protein
MFGSSVHELPVNDYAAQTAPQCFPAQQFTFLAFFLKGKDPNPLLTPQQTSHLLFLLMLGLASHCQTYSLATMQTCRPRSAEAR